MINVSGNGNRGGVSSLGQYAASQSSPMNQVSGALAGQGTSPGSSLASQPGQQIHPGAGNLGTPPPRPPPAAGGNNVMGAQFAAPGSKGVTSYGLFSRAGAGQRPPGQLTTQPGLGQVTQPGQPIHPGVSQLGQPRPPQPAPRPALTTQPGLNQVTQPGQPVSQLGQAAAGQPAAPAPSPIAPMPTPQLSTGFSTQGQPQPAPAPAPAPAPVSPWSDPAYQAQQAAKNAASAAAKNAPAPTPLPGKEAMAPAELARRQAELDAARKAKLAPPTQSGASTGGTAMTQQLPTVPPPPTTPPPTQMPATPPPTGTAAAGGQMSGFSTGAAPAAPAPAAGATMGSASTAPTSAPAYTPPATQGSQMTGMMVPGTGHDVNGGGDLSADANYGDFAANVWGNVGEGDIGGAVGTMGDYWFGQDGVAADTAGAVGGAAGNALAGAGSGVGNFLGEQFSDFKNSWDSATGIEDKQFGQFLNNPGFQGGSLMQDVGQNMTSMMDPGAWEQQARNREQAAHDQNLASLNLGERRLNDRSARSGLANNGGMLNKMYQDHGQANLQADRDIFNDALNNQTNAIGQAGQFAQGAQAQDQQRWQSLLQQSNLGATQDHAAFRQDNPSGASVLQDLLGAIGGVAGGAGQAAGQGASLIGPMLAMMGGM